jgi:hypothetical protein
MVPITPALVAYRGMLGHQAVRAAVVTANAHTLDPRGVESGQVPSLTSDDRVHLWVFTPSAAGGWPEWDVPMADVPHTIGDQLQPGHWALTWSPA